ncbi:MAG: DUF1939 domain-containing protein [Armatimonadetes bacterium]|nr:DUF1939 domain-containing protein [Armatimonadota bacterium]
MSSVFARFAVALGSVRLLNKAVFAAASVLLLGASAQAGVMMQGFYWDIPSPAAGNASAPWLWDKLAAQGNEMKRAGFTAVWIPSVLKGASGGYSMGYDPYDDYDMGSKNQQFTYTTRFGTREQLQRSVAMMRANGLEVYVDMVLNHRNGDNNWSFQHADAYGVWGRGRFQKGFYDFHPNVAQDPNVPDDSISFGRDVAHINGARPAGYSVSYVFDGLQKSGDWMTKALDIQGYRLDNVKGISTDFLRGYLNYGAMAGKFTVGEYYDGNLGLVNGWVESGLQRRASAFDFPLRDELSAMCGNSGFYNMRRLDHAGLTGVNPDRSVTWVENHDTDRDHAIRQNKMLAYAYILTSEGYPCVFYKDWEVYGLKERINNLVWIHEKLAAGRTQERWKDDDVFVYERMDGAHLLTGLNDNGAAERTITVQTGFGANVQLHDFTGHKPDVFTDGSGRVSITIPRNNGGNGYVAYSRLYNGSSGFPVPQYAVTQEFAGADDLDIKPADNRAFVDVQRIYVQGGKRISGALFWDATGWTSQTRVRLELVGTTRTVVVGKDYDLRTAQGATISATASRTGWYTLRIRSFNTPAANVRPAYWLRTTYTAPPL